MRKVDNLVFLSALVLVSIFVITEMASAGWRKAKARADVCSSVDPIGNDGLWKWLASDHINDNDPRAKGPSLICSRSNKRCVEWPAKVFHCDGEQAARGLMRRYGTWNVTGADRGYTHRGKSAAMRRVARQKECEVLLVQIERQRNGDPAVPCYSVDVDAERSGTPY